MFLCSLQSRQPASVHHRGRRPHFLPLACWSQSLISCYTPAVCNLSSLKVRYILWIYDEGIQFVFFRLPYTTAAHAALDHRLRTAEKWSDFLISKIWLISVCWSFSTQLDLFPSRWTGDVCSKYPTDGLFLLSSQVKGQPSAQAVSQTLWPAPSHATHLGLCITCSSFIFLLHLQCPFNNA